MTRVKSGDLDMLGLLFERYHKLLFTFFYRIHHSSATAEDLVQTVFMRILKYRKGFNGGGSFKVWMFHIARNVSRDHFKMEKKGGVKEDMDNWNERITDEQERRENIEREEQLTILYRAMNSLEPEKRELLVMAKLEGVKYRDLAELMDLTEGNIKIRVFRALKDLKKAYSEVKNSLDSEA